MTYVLVLLAMATNASVPVPPDYNHPYATLTACQAAFVEMVKLGGVTGQCMPVYAQQHTYTGK